MVISLMNIEHARRRDLPQESQEKIIFLRTHDTAKSAFLSGGENGRYVLPQHAVDSFRRRHLVYEASGRRVEPSGLAFSVW